MKLIRFYKPYGVLSKFTDAEGRSTLADYIDVTNVYPVGRLDRDSEGLMILTDNGALNARLIHPRYRHPRTYLVQVERVPDQEALRQLRQGVVIKGRQTLPAEADLLHNVPELPSRDPPVRFRKTVPTAFVQITLHEGRNRQVRRMTAAVGHPTLRLIRVAIGPIDLNGLTPGEWQHLTAEQRRALEQTVGW